VAAVAGFFDHKFAGAAAAAEDEDVCWCSWFCGHGELSLMGGDRLGLMKRIFLFRNLYIIKKFLVLCFAN
jgi:hypothetical protein